MSYDYFIIKELAEFKKQLTCLGESNEKWISFTPIEKEFKRIGKKGGETAKNISYILKFIDSAKFMASLLLSLVDNISEEIPRIKCRYEHSNKKYETCGIKYKYCRCFLEYTNIKDDLIENKCFCCNKNYQHKKKLKKS